MAACATSRTARSRWSASRFSERDALLRNAPHFVRPLPTTVPIQHVFSGLLNSAFGVLRLRSEPAERGALAVKTGLTFTTCSSASAGSCRGTRFRGREETAALWPDLPPSVRFTATYHDAWISHPERLGIELMLDGLAADPEALAINHLDGDRREDGADRELRDMLTGEEFAVTADLIVNATGAWLDETNAAIVVGGRAAGAVRRRHQGLASRPRSSRSWSVPSTAT